MSSEDLSPVEKLHLACEMHDLGVSIMRQNLRRRHPDAPDEEIDRLLREWLAERPGAEHGDGVGRRRG